MTHRPCLVVFGCLVLVASTEARARNSCVPGFGYAMFGKDDVTMTGGSVTNSYNSATGTFTFTNDDADVGTNSSSCQAISISGGVVINGDVEYGAYGTACAVKNSSSTITGTTTAQQQNQTMPSITIPTLGTNQGNISCSGSCAQPYTLAPNKTYGEISVGSGNAMTLTAGTYVLDGIKLVGGSRLIVGSGPVVVYLACGGGGELDLSGGNVTNSSMISTNLLFLLGPNCASAKVSGGSAASYAVYAPDTNVNVSGGSDIYGGIVAKTISVTGGTAIHYDRALASFAGGPFACPAGEISRASPIIATLGGTAYIVQGTYEYPSPTKVPLTPANASIWTFSFTKGHLRARTVASVTSSANGYSTGTSLFDAATRIPAALDSGCTAKTGSCRRVFTTTNTTPATGVTVRPGLVTLSDSTAPTVGPLITTPLGGTWSAANHTAIIRAVLRAPLGGVDRSTVAVIGPSTLASGGTTRPTIAYFGGTDGMLHAVCATTGGSTASQSNICPQVGTELWAFLPRVQLPLVGKLETRIDGSVHVIDAFGDFTTTAMTGPRAFRTILTFQTGFSSASAKPAAYAFDVTDPASPTLLWEYTTPTTQASLDFGAGLVATPGRALGSGLQPTNFVALETNNGGTGTAGVVATALQLETGTKLWQFGSTYPTAASVPATGLPGGAVGVDRAGSGFITDLVMGDLYGRLWRLDIKTGASVFGTSPLFQFSTERHPIGATPAIYSNGNVLYAAFASGGYADSTGTSWKTTTQYAIAVKLQPSATPVDETATACQGTCDLQVKVASSFGFAQASVTGTTLSLVSDSSDVNASTFGNTQTSTGKLTTVDLSSGQTSTTVIYSGIGGLAVHQQGTTATLYGGGNDKQQQVGSGISTTGIAIDQTAAKLSRKLWIRTQ